MKRKNFKLVYMVPKGTDEQIFERIVRTFQVHLKDDQIKSHVWQIEKALGHWPLEFKFLGVDEV